MHRTFEPGPGLIFAEQRERKIRRNSGGLEWQNRDRRKLMIYKQLFYN